MHWTPTSESFTEFDLLSGTFKSSSGGNEQLDITSDKDSVIVMSSESECERDFSDIRSWERLRLRGQHWCPGVSGWLAPKTPLDQTLEAGLRPLQPGEQLYGLTFPQTLDYVTTYVVPRLIYPLRVVNVRVKELEKVDKLLKEAIKSWTGVPLRLSDGFLYLPRHRLGLGLPSIHSTYRRARAPLATTNKGPTPPLAKYTREILKAQLAVVWRRKVLGLKMSSTNGGHLVKKEGRATKGEQPWLSHMLGAMQARLPLDLTLGIAPEEEDSGDNVSPDEWVENHHKRYKYTYELAAKNSDSAAK
ncbi:hypothetical protein Bbelb_349590 [Branchiostoma belcheri]|nr:hypothetical protein Bbelb_349590 [Branchiostoma belcheri]